MLSSTRRVPLAMGVVCWIAVALPGVLFAQASRGGWPDKDWLYIYEGSFEDGGAEGLDIAGFPDSFDDLDGTWDHNNPGASEGTTPWEGDLISDLDITNTLGGAEMMLRQGLGDNESGDDGAPDAETLAIFDANTTPGTQPANRRIYFERFLTDRSVLSQSDANFDDTGSGQPVIDFSAGVTVIARFRFFSLDALKLDPALRSELKISASDESVLLTVPDGNIEYDESPAESIFDQKGMFMVTRGDVYEGVEGFPGPGGIYFGMAEDGDDSWDPANQRLPPQPAEPVDVKAAFIVDASDGLTLLEPGDALIQAELKARGIQVTVLDDDGPEGHQFYTSVDPGFPAETTGPPAVAHDHDLVIISSTVQSNHVRADTGLGYRDLEVPFINWENALTGKGYAWLCDPNAGGFVIGSGAIGEPPIDSIEIVDNEHPITEDLELGPLHVFFTPQRVSATLENFGGNLPSRGVTVLARGSAAGMPIGCLLVADPECSPEPDPACLPLPDDPDPDCDLGDDEPPTARQVFFFLEDESFAAITENGHFLFHRAVEWALGEEKAALLAPVPDPPEPPVTLTIPSFYINLGASGSIPAGGFPFTTRVLQGSFLRDETNPETPAVGGDTRAWARLPEGTMGEFLSVYITVEPEEGGEGTIPRARVRVYFDGSTDPVIEIENHSLDPDILPAVFLEPDSSGPNDGTGLAMGLWREKQGGYLDVDYFGVIGGAVPPGGSRENRFVRGNCNGDDRVDISDAVFGLTHLFQGGPAPPCREACRINGDDRFDISDAVYVLTHLFQGGPPPRPPYPECDRVEVARCANDICRG